MKAKILWLQERLVEVSWQFAGKPVSMNENNRITLIVIKTKIKHQSHILFYNMMWIGCFYTTTPENGTSLYCFKCIGFVLPNVNSYWWLPGRRAWEPPGHSGTVNVTFFTLLQINLPGSNDIIVFSAADKLAFNQLAESIRFCQ